MKNLFDAATARAIRSRIERMRPDDQRQWGSMNAAQALAHCSGVLELALGERRPARLLIGRLLGWAIKPIALGNDTPLRRNTPTLPELVMHDDRDFEAERKQLLATIDRFVQIRGGARICTTHPHPFFGRLTPGEWAIHQYKHLDHHLRQFGR